MTTSPENPGPPGSSPASEAATSAEPSGPPSASRPPAGFSSQIDEGAQAFARRAEALGREAEVAGRRWSTNPAVKETADVAGRVWGLVLLVVGLWFFADVTLKLDMPAVAWRDLWPVFLILFGGIIVLRGMQRRS